MVLYFVIEQICMDPHWFTCGSGSDFKVTNQCCGSGSEHRSHMFLGLLDPDPDPLVRGMDPDLGPALDPDPSIIK